MAAEDVDEADELFEVEPERFVAARNELVTRLADEGRADDAAAIRKLRRPTLSVWALNQVARRHGDDVAALLACGDALRDAQERGDGAGMREAGAELRRRAAALAAESPAPGREDELAAALRVAASGGEPAEALRRGRFVRMPESSAGLEMWSAGTPTEAPAPEPEPQPAEDEVADAQARLREAEAGVERARQTLRAAEDLVGDLTTRLEDARAALTSARERTRDAERAARHATRDVDRAERRSAR